MNKKYLYISLLISIYLCFSSILVTAQDQYLVLNPGELLQLERVLVNYVYDGDTIRTAKGKVIRFIGIDTPEMNWEEREADFYAWEALEYTKEKLLNRYIYLEYGQEEKDKYGRVLAYPFLADGTFFNQRLLQKGYASLLLIPPNLKYTELLKEAAAEARTLSRGIWSSWDKLSGKLPEIKWQQAEQYLSKEVIVKGKIVNTYQSEKIIFLDFTKEDDDGLYLVIFKYLLNSFDYNPHEFLLGKEVKVTGKVVEYEGIPEIIIYSPLQIFVK